MKILFLSIFIFVGIFIQGSYVPHLSAEKTSSIAKDTSNMEYVLYNDVNVLKEDTVNNFFYQTLFDKKTKILSQISTCTLNTDTVTYVVNLKIQEKHFDKSKFNFLVTKFKYLSSSIHLNVHKINITNQVFANVKGLTIYPIGLGKSSSSTVLKYYEYNHKSYYLLSGGELECNGNQCTGYQIYIITKDNAGSYRFNALRYNGVFPYEFSNTYLFDQEKDGLPDIYVTKDYCEKVSKKSDFDIYSFNSLGNLVKQNSN
jgi:hypothetical protein